METSMTSLSEQSMTSVVYSPFFFSVAARFIRCGVQSICPRTPPTRKGDPLAHSLAKKPSSRAEASSTTWTAAGPQASGSRPSFSGPPKESQQPCTASPPKYPSLCRPMISLLTGQHGSAPPALALCSPQHLGHRLWELALLVLKVQQMVELHSVHWVLSPASWRTSRSEALSPGCPSLSPSALISSSSLPRTSPRPQPSRVRLIRAW
mmetsp:Transcript_8548/g.25730  ORF Transcript_8548/g.25730 Transcript_8548/m.25730 type:complete len:208 (-) Transcript_8548:1548-2171(-)